jgi:anti-anti-sigma factor
MPEAGGRILHARSSEGIHVLRLLGEVRYPLAPALDAWLRRVFEAGPAPAGFVIDLSQTEALDSTHLGLLARLNTRLRQAGAPRATLVTGRPDITEVLLSMGFDEEFHLVHPDGRPAVLEGQTIAEGAADDADADDETMARTVLEAHRALMALNERNREQFKDVVAILELEQAQRGSGVA